MARRATWCQALALCAGVVAIVGCAPIEPRLRVPESTFGNPFVRGTLAEAAWAVDLRVLQPSYLPPGARLREVDYSGRPGDQWVVQRYEVGAQLIYVAVEPRPPDGVQVQVEQELTVLGRPAIVAALRRTDGGVADWRVLWIQGDQLYTVGGDLPAEELVRVAAGLRWQLTP